MTDVGKPIARMMANNPRRLVSPAQQRIIPPYVVVLYFNTKKQHERKMGYLLKTV